MSSEPLAAGSPPANYPGSPDSAAGLAYLASPSPASSPTSIDAASVRLIELDPSDSAHLRAFKELNLAWVAGLFKVEPMDEEILSHPQRAILATGGRILLAVLPGAEGGDAEGEVVGTAALLHERDGRYELSKMSVKGGLQGRGIGRRLLLALIALYESLPGARQFFLESSTKLPNALRLYETCGFRHVPKPPTAESHYGRADVYMEWTRQWADEAKEKEKAAGKA